MASPKGTAATEELLVTLGEELRELSLGESVQVLETPPTALEFARIVAANRPVLIRGAISHWPALSRWTSSYLKDTVGDHVVTVAVTPDGYADSVVDDKYFVQPLYEKMPFREFMARCIEHPSGDPTALGVHYIQLQNDSLRTEFAELLKDIDTDIGFASEALGLGSPLCSSIDVDEKLTALQLLFFGPLSFLSFLHQGRSRRPSTFGWGRTTRSRLSTKITMRTSTRW